MSDIMKDYDVSNFEKSLLDLGIVLSLSQIEQFLRYYELLIYYNSFINLTAITDFEAVINKHFIDSLSVVRFGLNLNQRYKVIDIGTGAGFPGIPLKIAFPELDITLLDSLNKRIGFLDNVIDELKLDGIKTVHGRAEDCAHSIEMRESFDLSLSRAVADLSILAEYCLPFVKLSGFFVCYKSEKATLEMEQAGRAIEVLGGKFVKQVSFCLPQTDIYRCFCGIEKIGRSPAAYPRKAGVPVKKPIRSE